MACCYSPRMSASWIPVLMPRPLPTGVEMSDAAWVELPEDDAGELVDGRLEEEEVPDFVHELVVSWLIRTIGAWLQGAGFVVGSEVKALLRPGLGRKPDVIVILPGSPPPPRRGPLKRPPDVVVEVVTPTPRDERRDRVEKMAEYAAFGVPSYWLVDPALGSVEVFRRDADGNYVRAAAATDGTLAVPGCEGLVLDVDGLWDELSRLVDDEG